MLALLAAAVIDQAPEISPRQICRDVEQIVRTAPGLTRAQQDGILERCWQWAERSGGSL